MAPGLVDDAATRTALVAHAGIRAIAELWDRLDVALFGIGGPAWSVSLVGEAIEHQLEAAEAVGEVLVAPFDLDGRFVCPALRDRVIAFDARRLGRVPAAIGVAAGEAKVRPILGALRAGIVRTLVTDVATAEAVVALDEATQAAHGGSPAMSVREPVILGLDLGTAEVKAGLVALDGRLLALARSGYDLDRRGGHGWAEQDPGAWWSAVVSAVRALRASEIGEIVAHRRGRPRADARRGRPARRGHPAGDHVPRLARRRRGRRAGRGDRRSRLGAGRAAGRLVGRAPRARRWPRRPAGT